jgi:hypothetical protein
MKCGNIVPANVNDREVHESFRLEGARGAGRHWNVFRLHRHEHSRTSVAMRCYRSNRSMCRTEKRLQFLEDRGAKLNRGLMLSRYKIGCTRQKLHWRKRLRYHYFCTETVRTHRFCARLHNKPAFEVFWQLLLNKETDSSAKYERRNYAGRLHRGPVIYVR